MIHTAYRADYGPHWPDGIIDNQPPRLGDEFPSQVSQVDEFGNEVAGIRAVELRAPLATYYPWNLRQGRLGSPEELTDFRGTFVPLAATLVQRQARSDPRPSLEELYGSRAAYLELARQAAADLVRERLLRQEDVALVLEQAATRWDWTRQQVDPEK